MRRSVFLIIASLMVPGLVVQGCWTPLHPNGEYWITIAVVGPMTFIQGRDHLDGAQLACDDINGDDGVDVGGTAYGLRIYPKNGVETNEILDTSGTTGETALTAVIDDVDFVVGGFRTEAVNNYRDVAMNASKIFIGCGAASNCLQESVLTNYNKYKYWFRDTPYNSTFLFTSMLKQIGSVNSRLRAAANMTDLDPATTAACIVENAGWADAFATKLPIYLDALGFNMCAPVQRPASDQPDWISEMTSELKAINSTCGGEPMITVTVLSGPPGKAYGMLQSTYLPHTFTAGINVEAQDIGYHHDTGAEYHVLMDTWAEDVALTPYTLAFLSALMSVTGRYPCYCAATYDAVYMLKLAIEDVGGFTSSYTDDIIAWLENQSNAYTGVGGTTAYYPMPAIDLGGGIWAMNASQAYALYPHLPAYYGYSSFEEMAANWTAHRNDWTSEDGFLPHDTVYGPGWQTGIGAQWQPVDAEHPEGEWQKVGWWPYVAVETGANKAAEDLTPTEMATLKAAGLCDKYGNWNMEYPGTVDLIIPDSWVTYWSDS